MILFPLSPFQLPSQVERLTEEKLTMDAPVAAKNGAAVYTYLLIQSPPGNPLVVVLLRARPALQASQGKTRSQVSSRTS